MLGSIIPAVEPLLPYVTMPASPGLLGPETNLVTVRSLSLPKVSLRWHKAQVQALHGARR
jgi:hypothetical protein